MRSGHADPKDRAHVPEQGWNAVGAGLGALVRGDITLLSSSYQIQLAAPCISILVFDLLEHESVCCLFSFIQVSNTRLEIFTSE